MPARSAPAGSRRAGLVRTLPAIVAVTAISIWSVLSVVNAFGTVTGGRSAGSLAYEYQYSGSVNGSGAIASPVKGQVSFGLSAKLGADGSSGSCSVNEPATKTKVKCLDVTSLSIVTLGTGQVLAVIRGSASVNDVVTTYEIRVVDGGTPGKGNDSFSIAAGGFQRAGVLASGNLNVHL